MAILVNVRQADDITIDLEMMDAITSNARDGLCVYSSKRAMEVINNRSVLFCTPGADPGILKGHS